jgi:hypothetical protein
MELPTPPTDNLYKFQALAGLVSLIISIWYFTDRVDSTWLQVSNLEEETNLLKIEVDDAKDISITNNIYINRYGEPITNVVDIRALRLNVIELEKNSCRIDSKLKLVKYTLHKLYIQCALTPLALIGSLLLTYKGFKNWYCRIQVLEDQILKKQAEAILQQKTSSTPKSKESK